MDAAAFDRLAGADFRGFAQLLLAVNRYVAVGDHELGVPAAVHDSGKLEQVA